MEAARRISYVHREVRAGRRPSITWNGIFRLITSIFFSLGDAEGISKLASLAKEQGKNNVAFLCLFLLGKMEECIQLLLDSERIPEVALMARSYLPSKVSKLVSVWRNGTRLDQET